MKSNLAIVFFAVALFTSVGVAWGGGPLSEQSSDGDTTTASSLVIGHIAKIEGHNLFVEEAGSAPVQVQITPETVVPKNLKVGDEVMVSILADGVAAIITNGQIQAEVSVLDESGREAR